MDGNEKLNLAFVANLFNSYPCLPNDGDDDFVQESQDESLNETREEKSMKRNVIIIIIIIIISITIITITIIIIIITIVIITGWDGIYLLSLETYEMLLEK